MTQYHPELEHVLQLFRFRHLPPHLQEISVDYYRLAKVTADRAPQSQETIVALRKLLEAKDAAVRAVLPSVPLSELDPPPEKAG